MTGAPETACPDRLEGFPLPREAGQLVGHEHAEAVFLDAFRQQRLHHAWLLSGPEGIGKATLAFRVAKFMLRSGGVAGASASALPIDDTSVDVQLVATGNHPNLMVLRRNWNDKSKQFSAFITVDEVRELQHFLGTTAGKGRWRVVIVDTADDLNVNAANALLKMLEEPPAYCLFLLVSSQPGRLPVTIRSRCRRLRLEPLAVADLDRAVSAVAGQTGLALPPPEDLAVVYDLAAGSVRLALELIREGTAATFREVDRILDLLPRVDPQQTLALAERLGGRAADRDYTSFVQVLLAQIARRIRSRVLADGPGKRTLAQWAELWETVSQMRHDVDRLNLDRGNFIVDLFARIEDVAREAGGLGR
jgi:DNA polymerase-3 subunit delta'